jgi:hypothetical protein
LADSGSVQLQKSNQQEQIVLPQMSKIPLPKTVSNPVTLEISCYLFLNLKLIFLMTTAKPRKQ